jgi:fatty acid desaturase
MRPRWSDLALHVVRLAVSALVMALAARVASTAGMIAGAGLFFLEAFALQHDLAHASLGLPRRANEVALAAAGTLLLMSGHGTRRTHLRHHARTLAADDVEGAPARESFAEALLRGPRHALTVRAAGFRGAGPRGQRWQALETAVDVALFIALLASGRPALVIYAAVALLGQVTMSIWASHVPHNTPAWLVRAAERLAWTGSPTVLALAYHETHHARPDVPTRRMPWIAASPRFDRAAEGGLRYKSRR